MYQLPPQFRKAVVVCPTDLESDAARRVSSNFLAVVDAAPRRISTFRSGNFYKSCRRQLQIGKGRSRIGAAKDAGERERERNRRAMVLKTYCDEGNDVFKQFILHDSVHSLLSCNIQSFCLAMLFLFHANICLGYYDRASDRSPLLSPLECVLSLLFFSFLSEYLHVTMENECCITNASLIEASIVYISLGDDQIHDAVSLYGNKE